MWYKKESSRASAMTSILQRPLDLLIVVCVFFFLLIAVTIGKVLKVGGSPTVHALPSGDNTESGRGQTGTPRHRTPTAVQGNVREFHRDLLARGRGRKILKLGV